MLSHVLVIQFDFQLKISLIDYLIATCSTDGISLANSSCTCFLNFCCFGLWFHFVIFLSLQLLLQAQFSKNGRSFRISFSHVFFSLFNLLLYMSLLFISFFHSFFGNILFNFAVHRSINSFNF